MSFWHGWQYLLIHAIRQFSPPWNKKVNQSFCQSTVIEHFKALLFQTSFVQPFTQRFLVWGSVHLGRKLWPQGSNLQSGQDPIKISSKEGNKRPKRGYTGGDNGQLSCISVTALAAHISKITLQLVTSLLHPLFMNEHMVLAHSYNFYLIQNNTCKELRFFIKG